MKNKQVNAIESQLEKYREGKELTAEYIVEGIGTVKVYGVLKADFFIKILTYGT